MDIKVMIEFFKMTCQNVMLDCERAIYSDDVDDLEGDLCELDGMRKILQVGNDDRPLDVELLNCYFAAHGAFTRAYNRINYDPDTGWPRIKNAP